MVSSGIRIGATYTMQKVDLVEIPSGIRHLYKIAVYARTRDKYYTFCTPECYDAIQEYLDYQKRCLKTNLPYSGRTLTRMTHLRSMSLISSLRLQL